MLENDNNIIYPQIMTEEKEMLTAPLPKSTSLTTSSNRKVSFISEDGSVNLEALSPEQVAKCREITKNLSSKVVGSVANYGIELQSKLANSGKAFLTTTKASHAGEIGDIMSELLVNLNKINLKDVQDPNAFVRVLQRFQF